MTKSLLIILLTLIFILNTSNPMVANNNSNPSNLITPDYNPDFENWINASYPDGHFIFPNQLILLRSNFAYSGSHSLQIYTNSISSSFDLNSSFAINISSLAWYTFSFRYYIPSNTTGSLSVRLTLLDSSNQPISNVNAPWGYLTNRWGLETVKFLTTKDTASIIFSITMIVNSGTGEFFYDDLQLLFSSSLTDTSNTAINQNSSISNSSNTNNSFTILIFFGLIIGIIFIVYYFLKRNNPYHVQGAFANPLKQYWFCPYDRSPLQVEVNSYASNQYFIINKLNVAQSIQNAVAMKKIPPEVFPQAEQLANHIFTLTPAVELTLVSTKCPYCGRIIAAPRI